MRRHKQTRSFGFILGSRLAIASLLICGLSLLNAQAETKGVVRPKAKTGPEGDKVPPYKNVYVLCIGINAYSNMPELRYSEKDATELAKTFQAAYGFDTVTLLGKDATKSNVEKSIKDIKRKIGPEDDLIVYFSGHGLTVSTPGRGSYGEFARSGYLMVYPVKDEPAESKKGLKYNSINMKSFAQDLIKIKARHRLLILDCCFSGHAASYANVKDVIYGKEMLKRPTVQVMTAGTDKEEALEFNDIRHGVFTYELLQIIKELEDYTVDEVFFPLRRKVAKRAAERNYRLTPTLRGLVESEGEFVFIPQAERDNWQISANDRPQTGTTRGGGSSPLTEEELGKVLEDADAYDPASAGRKEKAEWARRVEKLQDRAAVGDERAMTALVHVYGKGIGVPKNDDMAYQWAREGYDTGKPSGLLGLSQAFQHGYGVKKDEGKAESLMKLFVDEGGMTDVMSAALPFLISDDSSLFAKVTAFAVAAGATKRLAGKLKGVTNINFNVKGKLGGLFSRNSDLSKRLTTVEESIAEGNWKKATKELAKWKKGLSKVLEEETLIPEKKPLLEVLVAQADTMTAAAEDLDAATVTAGVAKCREIIPKIEALDPPEPEKE